jgi:hypothetical protein
MSHTDGDGGMTDETLSQNEICRADTVKAGTFWRPRFVINTRPS